MPTSPSWDEMLTMEPPPARRMAGTAALVPRKTPLAVMCIMRSHAARGAADEGGLARQAHGDQLPGGRYPAPCASSMASKPSSGDMRAEVFRSFTAPLPMIAMETAAALTLLGTSKITTTS